MELSQGSKLVISSRQLSKMGIELVLINYEDILVEEQTVRLVASVCACNNIGISSLQKGEVEWMYGLLDYLDDHLPNFDAVVEEYSRSLENDLV